MDPIWSLGAVACSLAAVAALGLAWAIWRRTPRDGEGGLLSASLAALALGYAAAAGDAYAHLGGTAAPNTLWSVAAHVSLALFWSLLCCSLVRLVRRVYRPDPLDGAKSIYSISAAIVLFMVLLSGRLILDLLRGAPGARIEGDMAALMSSWANFAPPWLIAPTLLFQALYKRLPARDQHGWPSFVAGKSQEPLISLNLAEYPAIAYSPSISRRDFGALSGVYVTGFLLLFIFVLNGTSHWTPVRLGGAFLLRLLLLPSLVGIVYVQAKYSFFDVVLKRGLLFCVAAAVVTSATFLWAPHDPPAKRTGLILLVLVGAALLQRGDRTLDRLVFRRPDYRVELQALSKEMARCRDVDALSAVVTRGLAQKLGTSLAEFGPRPAEGAQVAVRIGTAERTHGYLSLGLRERGLGYRGEDLNFLDAVAGQFTALLESFEARQAQHLAATAELRALRAQINPHFLFNALNTLAEMVNGQEAAERVVLNLSRVFRFALDSTRHELVSLGEEIAAVRAYLEIEAERFEDKLRYEIAAGEELFPLLVPPMLIQPLVENALKHGLAPKLEGGTVWIAADRQDGRLRLTVRDDGLGFDPARTDWHVGLSNVRARVEKGGGSWSLESAPGRGTAISFEVVLW